MATSRQFAQRARRHRERLHRHAVAQPTDRDLAQRARRNREYLLTQPNNAQLAQRARQNREHEPFTHQPLVHQPTGTPSLRHRLGPCDVLCNFCGADHWMEEKVKGSSLSAPQFSTCCERGTIMMDRFQDPPEPLFSLLTDMTPGIFPTRHSTNN